MKVELKYIFECGGGFKYVRDTPEEITQIFNANLDALNNLERCNVNSFFDGTNKFFPRGSITAKLDGNYKFYELRTEIIQINA